MLGGMGRRDEDNKVRVIIDSVEFLVYFVYSFICNKDRKLQEEITICYFTVQMPATAEVGLGRIQESET